MGGSWLITGGTGSFGMAFVRHLLSTDARRVVVLSRDELKQARMAEEFPDPRMRFLIGSVADPDRIGLAMRGVDHVVHAAAMKRVETCEANPHEAFQTNLYGTQVVARACLTAGVKRAVFLSTDKAVQPNTMYGCTKLAAERLWVRSNVYAAGTDTRYAATRYGNVLGSNGAVLQVWKSQAAAGGPLTITSEGMTRFWMPMAQAVELVLLAFREMRGGEVFIPKLASGPITDLASVVAPGCEFQVTGIRPGEKIHEALVSEDEARDCYDWGDHYRIETTRTWEDVVHTDGKRVPEGFSYRSDTNTDRMTATRLRELVA